MAWDLAQVGGWRVEVGGWRLEVGAKHKNFKLPKQTRNAFAECLTCANNQFKEK